MVDLGTKHECTGCSTKFYDLGKAEPICPKCGLNQLADEQEAEQAPAEEEGADDKKKAKKKAKKPAK
jgi:hypothetical protein